MADADAYRADLLGRFRWIGGHADVLGLFADGPFLGQTVDALAGLFADDPVDLVAGIEARGFVLAPAVATRIGAGFVPVRKSGAIHPGPKAVATTDPDWRGRRLELAVQRHAVQPGARVLLVDDWAETGSQAAAARAAIQSCGACWVGAALLVDQLEVGRRAMLAPVRSILLAADLPPNPGWATRWARGGPPE